jgi:arylsulfatase A-like enzyme
MPNVQQLIADEGTTFERNYSPDPICCPARATILTGQYPHNHGVVDNVWPNGGFRAFDDSSTLATWLDPDYRTGLFGKYMNDNGSQREYVPPGWDDFKTPTRRDTYRHVAPNMWVNGRLRSFPYQDATALYARQARAFMSHAVGSAPPFPRRTSRWWRHMRAARTTTTLTTPAPRRGCRRRTATPSRVRCPPTRPSTRRTSPTSRRTSRTVPRSPTPTSR